MNFDKIVSMQQKAKNRARVARFLEPYSDLACKFQDIVLWINPVISAIFCVVCFAGFHSLYALCTNIPPLCLVCILGIIYIVCDWISTNSPGVLSFPFALIDKALPEAVSTFDGPDDNTVVGNASKIYDYAVTLYATFMDLQAFLKALTAFGLAYFLFFIPTPLFVSIIFTFVMAVPGLIYNDVPNKIRESVNNAGSNKKDKKD